MFFNNNNNNNANNSNNVAGSSETMMSMMRNLQTPPFVSPMDQNQASIIKNENGMYTIRNPAFQSIFSGGNSSGGSSSAQPTVAGNNSYGNGMMGSSYNANSNYNNMPPSAPTAPSTFSSFEPDYSQQQNEMPKCNSVIGSEMKNVLQRRKEQEYMDWNHGMRSQYSHFGGMNFNGNNCDESFGRPARPSSSGSGCYPSPTMSNYDELRLQPGKMLNSEVNLVVNFIKN